MIINAYFGIAYAVVYGIVCISRGIFGLGIMSLVYTLAVQIILLIIWHKNSRGNTVKVRGFTWLKRLMVLGIMAFIFAGLFFVLRFFSTNNQLLDAAVTTLNLTSMALLILRYYEAWFIAALAHLSNSILWLTTILAGSQSIVLFVSSVISFVFSAYAVYNWIKIQKIQKSL